MGKMRIESPLPRCAFSAKFGTMVQSFTADDGALADASRNRRKVLVTGAAGNIGSYFAEHNHERYDLRLMVRGWADKKNVEAIRPFGEVVEAELSDLDRMKELCAGIDTVLHLAANPSASAMWDSVLPDNIIGTYHTFVAAKAAGCRRVIYASSIHAVSGYPPDVQVKTSEPVNPGDLYGVSKCFGEALARYMAEQEGLSSICIRIGGFQPLEYARQAHGIHMLDAFVSHRDLNQLLQKCIDVENLRFAILHGLSDNRFKRLDISDARELVGYQPQDDATQENPQLRALNLSETVSAHNMRDDGQASGIRGEL
jgi:NAD(P)-dependent dehydrogenase (short-subunit alcohol dehydrogenase family)